MTEADEKAEPQDDVDVEVDDDEPDMEDILVRSWRDHDKYVCAICERFQNLSNPAPVREHIDREH